jgi:hypothetical protein
MTATVGVATSGSLIGPSPARCRGAISIEKAGEATDQLYSTFVEPARGQAAGTRVEERTGRS